MLGATNPAVFVAPTAINRQFPPTSNLSPASSIAASDMRYGSGLKGAKRARVETAEQTAAASETADVSIHPGTPQSANQEPNGRPRLLLANQELSERLGKKYCDEFELLPLLLKHGIIRRVWTKMEKVPAEGAKKEDQTKRGLLTATLDKSPMLASAETIAKIISPSSSHTSHTKLPANPDDELIRRSWGSLEITLEMLQAHFHLPIVDASRAFDVCTTRLKKVCRQYGIKRWPHRQVRIIEAPLRIITVPVPYHWCCTVI
jgi:hypothetical protein